MKSDVLTVLAKWPTRTIVISKGGGLSMLQNFKITVKNFLTQRDKAGFGSVFFTYLYDNRLINS